jgi:hypothetical protein
MIAYVHGAVYRLCAAHCISSPGYRHGSAQDRAFVSFDFDNDAKLRMFIRRPGF